LAVESVTGTPVARLPTATQDDAERHATAASGAARPDACGDQVAPPEVAQIAPPEPTDQQLSPEDSTQEIDPSGWLEAETASDDHEAPPFVETSAEVPAALL